MARLVTGTRADQILGYKACISSALDSCTILTRAPHALTTMLMATVLFWTTAPFNASI